MARASEVANARAFFVHCALSLLSCPLYFQESLGMLTTNPAIFPNMHLETG